MSARSGSEEVVLSKLKMSQERDTYYVSDRQPMHKSRDNVGREILFVFFFLAARLRNGAPEPSQRG